MGDIPVIHDPAELVLPLDAYEHTGETWRAFANAEAKLVRECLGRFGVDVPSGGLDPGEPVPYDRKNERRYGLIDLDLAASNGYSPSAEFEGPRFSTLEEAEEGRRAQGRWYPAKAEQFLLDGHSKERFKDRILPVDSNGDQLHEAGCWGEAREIVADGLPDPEAPVDAGVDSFYRSARDSRVESVVGEWQACMAERGYDYGSIWEPNEYAWHDPVTEREIATAVSDVECKLETNLVGIWYAVESAYQRRFIEENAEWLDRVKTWLDIVYANSVRVLEET